MVDVSGKAATHRRARAEGIVTVAPETLRMATHGRLPKGDIGAVARLAAIGGAKRAADLVPLCHPVRLDSVSVEVSLLPPNRIRVEVEAVAFDRTGVEMEALAAVAAGALAVYDMVKGVDRGAEIGPLRLLEKSGGRSGTWARAKPRRGK
jgi:cyclic pyranopterin phosphate synthase